MAASATARENRQNADPDEESAERRPASLLRPEQLAVDVAFVGLVFRLEVEAVAISIDRLRGPVGDAPRTAAKRADEELQLEPQREREDEQQRHRLPQLVGPEDPGEDNDDDSDAKGDGQAHTPTVPGGGQVARLLSAR